MSYRKGESNTRKYVPKFTVDQWIAFREKLDYIIKNDIVSERDQKILTEIIKNYKTTAQLAYLAQTDEEYSWLQSNRCKPLSERQIGNILRDNFPEFTFKPRTSKIKKIQKSEPNKLKSAKR